MYYTVSSNYYFFRKERNAKYPNLKPFLPPSFPKKHATTGDSHGTFGGNIKGK